MSVVALAFREHCISPASPTPFLSLSLSAHSLALCLSLSVSHPLSGYYILLLFIPLHGLKREQKKTTIIGTGFVHVLIKIKREQNVSVNGTI